MALESMQLKTNKGRLVWVIVVETSKTIKGVTESADASNVTVAYSDGTVDVGWAAAGSNAEIYLTDKFKNAVIAKSPQR